uniref:Phosphotransferase n=1 Tax=Glossina brevipalpis TaxID=37001 RepID=A0A1A9WH74_9MUSC
MAQVNSNENETEKDRKIVKSICKSFILNDDIYKQIKEIFLGEIKKSLCKYTHESASVKCFMTFVEKLPSGCECGKSLALDVNETNCRVLYINLQGGRDFRTYTQDYPISPQILVGPGRDLFDFFVECIVDFIQNHKLEDDELTLGFNFRFPLKQTSINKAKLITWTKDITCAGVVGRNVVALLQAAIDRRGGIRISNIVIANDTTSTLISCAWKYREAKIGLNISTGFNMCYLEKTKYIQLSHNGSSSSSSSSNGSSSSSSSSSNSSATMLINCVLSAFGNGETLNFMRTPIDFAVDSNSSDVGEKIFEKMILGIYLGEIVRLTMLECIKAGAMLHGNITNEARTPNVFDIKDMSEIETDGPGNYRATREIFEKIGYTKPTVDDCENLRYICTVISTRSAHLIASCLACLVDRIGDPYLIIGVEGDLCETYPNYSLRLERKLKRIVRPEHHFDMVHAEDSLGRGIAVLAASSKNQKTNN